MREFVAFVTSDGRVTIPSEVVQHLVLEQGGYIAFVIDDEGDIRLQVLGSAGVVASLAGAAGSLTKRMTWSEVREIAREDRRDEKHTSDK